MLFRSSSQNTIHEYSRYEDNRCRSESKKFQLPGIIVLIITFLNSHAITAGEHDHHKAPNKKSYTISYPLIKISDISMSNTENKTVRLLDELNKGPVVVNFIFTSCTAICPILSSTFSQIQKRFDQLNNKNISLISFSIDPERDTPARLKEYAAKFNAGDRWNFYTGTVANMRSIENMFGNYRGNKMNHLPYTFIRMNKDSQWIRLKGFVSASVIIDEINKASLK
ncbi:MAG: SCO family protein [Thiohalomonadales bacterium]